MPDESQPQRKKAYCPGGHAIPHQVAGKGYCSKKRCIEQPELTPGAEVWSERGGHGEQVINLDKLKEVDPRDHGRLERAAQVGLKKTLKGDDALRWAQDKMVELLPEAVANVAWDMRYGTDKQRTEATDKVLRANGMDKKDANQQGQSGLIILQLGAGSDAGNIPWLSRMKPSPKAVAEATGVRKPEDDEE